MIRDGSAIRDIYPDYVEAGNVYQFLADGYVAKGDKKAAIAELERYAKVGGRSPDTLKQLATLLEEAGNRKEAAEVLDRLNYIQPIDEDLHRRLGDLWLGLGNTAGAIREYQRGAGQGAYRPRGVALQPGEGLPHGESSGRGQG